MFFVAPDEWERGEVMMKELRIELSDEAKEAYRGVTLPVDGLVEALRERGIHPMDAPAS